MPEKLGATPRRCLGNESVMTEKKAQPTLPATPAQASGVEERTVETKCVEQLRSGFV